MALSQLDAVKQDASMGRNMALSQLDAVQQEAEEKLQAAERKLAAADDADAQRAQARDGAAGVARLWPGTQAVRKCHPRLGGHRIKTSGSQRHDLIFLHSS